MPRKAKENEELKEKKSTKKSATSKKSNSKSKSESTKTIKKVSAKNESTKKTAIKKTTSKKSNSTNKEKQKKNIAIEYYDLPQKYNKTIVKVLAQTPKTLFIYWEISDNDIDKYKKQYGENFFETTKPVLKIHNNTLNYTFEVDINDFANSWYLHVNDSKSDYKIELGRRPINTNNKIENNYIYITSSNEIESPNDHILFNTSQKMVYFRNVKTNQEFFKNMSTLSFMRNMGKIYDIYDLYNELYKNEDNIDILSNPSSYTSSQFK